MIEASQANDLIRFNLCAMDGIRNRHIRNLRKYLTRQLSSNVDVSDIVFIWR